VGAAEGVRVLSFKSPDGKIVTELMNRNKTAAKISLVFHGNTLPLELPGTSISTAMWPE
jgi:O-glycosyl hydrolase